MNEPVEFERGCYVGKKITEQSFGKILTTETIFSEDTISDWHYHQNPHYSHILSGGSKETKHGTSNWQQAGDGLYYYPGVSHQNLQYHPGTRIFNLELEADFFNDHDLNMPVEEQMFSEKRKVNSMGLLRILKEHRWQDQQSKIAIEQLCVNLVSTSPITRHDDPAWTRKIIELVNDHWDHSWSLAEFSGTLNIHPVTLSKYFFKYFNCTLGDYIREVKIERALRLIQSHQLSLTEVAYACGFADQAHFTKTFYLVTGMLPKQYRSI